MITEKQSIKGSVSAKQSVSGKVVSIPSLDYTLSKQGFAADSKAVGDALSKKANEIHKHSKSEITDFPTEMPASDVYEWAKQKNKPTYTAQEVGARPNTWMPNAEQVGARPNTWMPNAEQVGARPNTWMPSASDVGASPMEYTKKVGNPHNLLDNSDFRNPVNQRGQTSYVYDYCIDRWFFYNEDTQNSKIEVRNGYIHLESPTQHNFAQRLPLTIDTAKIYTLAYKTLSGDVFIRHCQPSMADGFCYVCPYDSDIGGSIDLVWCAMYEGEYTAETLPEYQPKGYGAELAECQRYANVLEVTGYGRVGLCKSSAGEAASILFVDTPVMRSGAVPSISLISGDWRYLHTEFGGQTVTSITGFAYQIGTKHNLLVNLLSNNPTQTIEPLINASENAIKILISRDL